MHADHGAVPSVASRATRRYLCRAHADHSERSQARNLGSRTRSPSAAWVNSKRRLTSTDRSGASQERTSQEWTRASGAIWVARVSTSSIAPDSRFSSVATDEGGQGGGVLIQRSAFSGCPAFSSADNAAIRSSFESTSTAPRRIASNRLISELSPGGWAIPPKWSKNV